MTVFISHSSADKPFVRRLKDALESKGLTTWLDEAEIRVGESIPKKIASAIAASEIFCIVLSRTSHDSKWVEREFNAFLPFFIKNEKAIVPCKIDDSPCPVLIGDIKYADFSESFKKGIKQLFEAVRVREAIQLHKRMEDAIASFTLTLSRDEQHFVLGVGVSRHWFFSGYSDRFKTLDKLCLLGILDCDCDRYERLYTFTELGNAVIDELTGFGSGLRRSPRHGD